MSRFSKRHQVELDSQLEVMEMIGEGETDGKKIRMCASMHAASVKM